MGAVSGDINTLSLSVDTAADLSSRPTAALKSGDRAYITSKIGTTEGPLFFIDKSSVLAVDGVGVLATNSGVGRWLSEALYGGVEAPISVANAAALAAVPSASFDEGMLAWVETFRSYFRLDPASALAADGKVVIAASDGGRWLRDTSYRDYTWSLQATWFIDPANGNDENIGDTSGTAVATWAEFTRRVSVLSVSMTVTVLSNIAENILGEFSGAVNGLTCTIEGNPTVLATGAITAVANPNPATNAEGTLTSADIGAFAPYVGRIVEVTTGAAATAQTVVLADVAGTAQTPYWARRTTFTNPTPAPGDTIRVLQMTTVPTIQINFCNVAPVIRYFDTTASSSWVASDMATVGWEACELLGIRTSAAALNTNFIGCSFKAGGSQGFRGAITFLGGAVLRNMSFGTGEAIGVQGVIFYGASLSIGLSTDNTTPCVIRSSGTAAAAGIGIFNVAGTALTVNHGSRMQAAAPIYGDGNTTGLSINDGGVVQIGETVTPTITGATEIIMDGSANQQRPIRPGEAVPANWPTDALTTWAQWAAAPYSRSAVNYATLSRITGV